MPEQTFLQRLKERKLVQWGLAYLAGAFVVFQGLEVMAEPWSISPALQRSVHILLIIGLVVTLILAWYHGEMGRQRVSGAELLMLAVLLVIAGAVLSLLGTDREPALDASVRVDDAEQPLVVMMDSPHPDRVYDEEILEANGTNADAISDILADLPIRRQKEAIGPDWHRDEDIAGFDPDLVVIHYSGFRQGFTDAPRERLKLFISYLAGRDTQFLIYSRMLTVPQEEREEALRRRVTELLADLEEEHSGLMGRVRTFCVTAYGPPKWLDPGTSTNLKLVVKEMLGLE
jgi:hypothetical protein